MGPVEVVICSGHLYHHFGVGDNPGRKFYLFYVPLSTSVPKFLTTKQVHRSAKKIQKCRKFIYVRLKRVILKVILSQFRGHVFIFWPNGNFRDNLPVIIFRAKNFVDVWICILSPGKALWCTQKPGSTNRYNWV